MPKNCCVPQCHNSLGKSGVSLNNDDVPMTMAPQTISNDSTVAAPNDSASIGNELDCDIPTPTPNIADVDSDVPDLLTYNAEESGEDKETRRSSNLNSKEETKANTTANAAVHAVPEMIDVATQTKLRERLNSYSELSDNNLHYFTGLERERFEILYKMIEKFDAIEESLFWSKNDALLITLHKCRHNIDFKMMEFIFEIDRRHLSDIFKDVIQHLYHVLKQMDIWNMSFTDSKSYRCILDCTEFFVVRAGNPNVHQMTFSTYKHHPTFKLLVSCDEKGAVNFISDAFVGSTSDREVVVKSGLLEKLEKNDSVLADRGFDISDLLESKGVLLNIFPFLRGKAQLSNYEVMKTRIIASYFN